MISLIIHLREDQGGAVTVDWVVLTAAMVGLGALIVLGISDAATDSADGVGAFLTNYEAE